MGNDIPVDRESQHFIIIKDNYICNMLLKLIIKNISINSMTNLLTYG